MERSELNANSVDPDQTPRSAASDLGLHCLPMSYLWDAKHKWVNQIYSRETSPSILTRLQITNKSSVRTG